MARRSGADTKTRIEQQALRLFASSGVDGTSMRDLAGAAGVAEAAIYRHFASKEAIGQEIFNRHYAELAQHILAIGETDASFTNKIHRLVALFCDLFDTQPDIFSFLLIRQHHHLRAVEDGAQVNAVTALSGLMQDAIGRGHCRITDPNLASAMALGVVVQPAIFAIYGRLHRPLADSADAMAEAIVHMLI